jgi:glycosyltransferase involved in cell wall biosynthesis
MKLIIQIPCLNEEDQLGQTLADLPRELSGIDEIEWLVIDDGSSDATLDVARHYNADHIVRLTKNKGLAVAFAAGLDACLKLGADLIVNTDGDHHYPGAEIRRLVAPILEGRADMVIADREISANEHFSPVKRSLQSLGSAVVRHASGTDVPDATSGFRAYNREAAIQLEVVVSDFTYTLETIIQAGKNLVAIDNVAVRVNPQTRQSRLFPSIWTYIRRNAVAIFRVYSMYEPLKVFLLLAAVLGVAATAIWGRFIYFYITGSAAGHLQSLILGAVVFLAAAQMVALGIVSDILASCRVLQQRTLERIRRVELRLGVGPSHYEPADDATSDKQATTGAGSGIATGNRAPHETVEL